MGALVSDITTATSRTRQRNGVVQRCSKVPRDVQNVARAAEMIAPVSQFIALGLNRNYINHLLIFFLALTCSISGDNLKQKWPQTLTGWPRHRENRENREFGSYFFQTGKTQGILF